MKLTLKRTLTTGTDKIEDEIYLDDDNPILTQYDTQHKEMINPADVPFDRLVVHSSLQQLRIVNFPFVEFLCRQIFSDQSEKSETE